MRIPSEIKQAIQDYSKQNIAAIIGDYLPLTKSGHNLSGCCPFHSEKTPSFVVSPERGTWRCYGSCSEGGDAAKFIMKIDGVDFNVALQKLAAKGSITIPGAGESPEEKERKAVLSVLAKADEFYRSCLTTDKTEGRAYTDSRMTPEMVKAFGIGFAPKNGGKALTLHLESLKIPTDLSERAGLIRKDDKGVYRDVFWGGRIMFPIKNKAGYTIGFAGRTITTEQKYKYINSPETSCYKKYDALFGLDKADFSSGEVFVVEGYLDHMQMWQAGVRNVVAACGTSFTAEHVAVLKKLGVRKLNLMFDGDNAGIKATQKAVTLAYTEDLVADVFSLPAGQDPDDFFKSGGQLNNIIPVSGLDFLEKSGAELSKSMQAFHRLERMEKVLLKLAKQPAVATSLKKWGHLDKLFCQENIPKIEALLQ